MFIRIKEFFESRLYPADYCNHSDKKGLGARCYSNFIGKILAHLGLAMKTDDLGQVRYVNKKSYYQMQWRYAEAKLHPEGNFEEKVQMLYSDAKERGYNKDKIDLIKLLNKIEGSSKKAASAYIRMYQEPQKEAPTATRDEILEKTYSSLLSGKTKDYSWR